jgi:Domain of unknown function (DUF4124)
MKPTLPLLSAVTAMALAIGGSLPAQAETVYKWVDQNGVTNYTTTPPLPTVARKTEAINAAPALDSHTAFAPGAQEAQYWRLRRENETADALRDSRQRRESQELQQQLLRQQISSSYEQDQLRAAENRRRQAAFDQCMFDRRLDCANPDAGAYGPAGVVRVGHQRPGSIFTAAPFPVPGTPLVSNPTPGAPSLGNFNNTPGAFSLNSTPSRPVQRPAVAAALGGR